MIGLDPFHIAEADPSKVYRWVNANERVLVHRMQEGWKVSEKDRITPEARKALMNVVGQSTMNPDGGSVMRVGDLVLMEMDRDVHTRTVAAKKRAARERQAVSIDTLIIQANNAARAAMKGAGQSNIRARHVFTSTADDNLEGELKNG